MVGLERTGRAEETRLGLADVREAGRVGGPSVITPELRAAPPTTQIAQELGVGKTTIRRTLTTEML